ncbi:hypothetical protein D1AOALGA4SA_2762 [Olavius algarvensis Delta 1 endosymbiont]|nr:hypothetical protein D1AOALGA4SA_2762 [Olavius algarvensis Delta 1 endosymbiont]
MLYRPYDISLLRSISTIIALKFAILLDPSQLSLVIQK